ncbi:MAG: B-box zinc finger protein [Terracidiphilus sp.]|nr:B-box zinc finger protein [Terracidiphilus sp.]
MAAPAPAADPVCCPSCAEHFRKPPSGSVPMTLACCHNICGVCLEAMALAGAPRCPICAAPAGEPVLNRGLAAYADEVYVAAREGDAEPEDVAVDEGTAPLIPLSQCREHPDEALQFFCLTDMRVICGVCWCVGGACEGQ